MDLTTTYCGLELAHPIMPGASPLADDLDTVRKLEDAGAAAITLRSLFEEQIEQEQIATADFLDSPADSFAEAMSYLPAPTDFALGPEEYLEQIRRIRAAVDIPVIASLNGPRGGRWLDYAELIEEAGASALELNLYELVTSVDETAGDVEDVKGTGVLVGRQEGLPGQAAAGPVVRPDEQLPPVGGEGQVTPECFGECLGPNAADRVAFRVVEVDRRPRRHEPRAIRLVRAAVARTEHSLPALVVGHGDLLCRGVNRHGQRGLKLHVPIRRGGRTIDALFRLR